VAPKTKLNEALISEICTAVKACNREVISANKSGIPDRTFYRWKKQGKIDIASGLVTVHSKFVEALQINAASAEVRMLAIIAMAATEKWQAAAWWLERTRPDHYGLRPRSENTEHTREAKSAVRQLVAHLTGEVNGDDDDEPPAAAQIVEHRMIADAPDEADPAE
jgi:hypothetical protein